MDLKNLYILALINFSLFLGGTIYNGYFTRETLFERNVAKATRTVNGLQKAFNTFSKDTTLLNSLITDETSKEKLDKLQNLPFYTYVYKDNKLKFWSTNQTLINVNHSKINKYGLYIENKNGHYIGLKKEYKGYDIVGLHLIKTKYDITNNYLKNEFPSYYSFDKSVEVLPPFAAEGYSVKDKNEISQFKVRSNGNTVYTYNFVDIIGYISLMCFYFFILFVVRIILNKYGFFHALLSMFFLSILFLFVFKNFDYSLKDTLLFSPELYASQYLGQSLGDLLIYALTGSYLLLFIVVYYYVNSIKSKLIYFGGLTVLLCASLIIYISIIKSLILNSVISFDFIYFLSINIFSVAGISIVLITGIAVFGILSVWFDGLYNNQKELLLPASGVLMIAVMAVLYFLKVEFFIITLYTFLLALYLLTIYIFYSKDKLRSKINLTSINLVYLSALIAISFNFYIEKDNIERQENLAIRYSEKRDLLTEYHYSVLKRDVKRDPYIKRFFMSPFVSKKELSQRLDYIYFGGYLSKYNIKSYAFNSEGKAIKTADSFELRSFQNIVKNNGEETSSADLYLIQENNGKNSYISFIPFQVDSQKLGTLVLQFEPKIYTRENLYPELLIEKKINSVAEFKNDKDYNYGIYKHNNLIHQSGEYPYPYFLGSYIPEGHAPNKTVYRNGYRHNFYNTDDDTTVIISSPQITLAKPFTMFSYIFAISILIILLILIQALIANVFLHFLPQQILALTFKNRINITTFLITISSFTMIGITTVSFFIDSYEKKHINDLINKQKTVLSSLLYQNRLFKLDNYDNIPSALNNEIASLSEIQGIDINLFDTKGKILVSSQPSIFSNGLISKYINPYAYLNLKKIDAERFIQDEKIGALDFKSIYVPVRTKNGEIIAYLNIPYFAQAKALKAELSDLIVSLVNVYVILLFLSILATYLISNSVTRPLNTISEGIKKVSLGKKNKEIVWDNANDEIGALVNEYNKMIREIDISAKALARSEREHAWREMARQIAHEIKNPLTPMKLSVQHLKRAIQDNDERVPELTKRVSDTIIEQIDNLNDIASAFSNFAKMPKADKSNINLIYKLQSVVDLFNKEDDKSIHFSPSLTKAYVYADNNQLTSVFNNLIKNALQATEEKKEPIIQVYVEEKDGYYLTSIIDNGCGIPDEKKDKVFVPNFTTKSSGTGLGLAISKQIIENSDGYIWFKSEVGVGTTFFVSLPIKN